MNPYAKYMKDIVTNKRKIPEAEISTMLANYTFKGGMLGYVAEIENFLRITKINLWSLLATRGKECIYIPL